MTNFLKYGEQYTTHHTTQNLRRSRGVVSIMRTWTVFIAAQLFLSSGDDLQIGATDAKAAGQHFNLLQQAAFNHPPEGRAADA